jgi:hypothetical protein
MQDVPSGVTTCVVKTVDGVDMETYEKLIGSNTGTNEFKNMMYASAGVDPTKLGTASLTHIPADPAAKPWGILNKDPGVVVTRSYRNLWAYDNDNERIIFIFRTKTFEEVIALRAAGISYNYNIFAFTQKDGFIAKSVKWTP